jgi:hypothetical protein
MISRSIHFPLVSNKDQNGKQIKSQESCDVTRCRLLNIADNLKDPNVFIFRVKQFKSPFLDCFSVRWRQQNLSKRRHLFVSWHSTTSQKTEYTETFLGEPQISQTKKNPIRTFFLRKGESCCPFIYPHRFAPHFTPVSKQFWFTLWVTLSVLRDKKAVTTLHSVGRGLFQSWRRYGVSTACLLLHFADKLPPDVGGCVCVCMWIECVCNMHVRKISMLITV